MLVGRLSWVRQDFPLLLRVWVRHLFSEILSLELDTRLTLGASYYKRAELVA